MIFQSNSPLSAISTEPRFKYLSPQAKKLFDDAKAKYLVLVGNTPENSQKFDNFVNNIDKNRSAASAINDAVDLNNGTDRALLKKIDILPSKLSDGKDNPQRDNFYDGLIVADRNSNGTFTRLRVLELSSRFKAGGTLTFSINTIEKASFVSQLFVTAHEVAHAKFAQKFAADVVRAANSAYSAISASTKAIAQLGNSQQASATIDVTAHVRAMVRQRMINEGRANVDAFNQIVADLNVNNIPFGQEHLKAIWQSEEFRNYLVQIDPTFPTDETGNARYRLVPGLTANARGFLDLTDANFSAAADANIAEQARYSSLTSHNVVYAAGDFATLLLHSSNVPQKIDLSKLNINAGVPFQEFIRQVSQMLKNSLGEYKYVDPTTGAIKSITVTPNPQGGENIVSFPDVVSNAPASLSSPPQLIDTAPVPPEAKPEKQLPRGLKRISVDGRDIVVDKFGRELVLEFDRNGNLAGSKAQDGYSRYTGKAGVTVDVRYVNNKAVDTNIRINGNPIGVEFSDFGSILGQQLGFRLAGNNAGRGIVYSAVLQTLGDNLGDALDGIVGRQSQKRAIDDAFSTSSPELLANLKSAGVGAISSFLTAQLINVIGLDGFAGELGSTVSGTVLNTIVSNIAGLNGAALSANPFANIGLASLPTAIASFLGNRLANEVVSFDTIGGQIGAAVGSALGVIGGVALGKSLAVLGAFGGPIGALVGAFLGTIIGGLIGSVFGGTPRSGADAQWDDVQGKFIVTNVYSRKGGSKDAARSLASVAAETFNDVLEATGGRLARPGDVTAGNYGMRKSDFVYRPTSTQDSNLITYRVSTKDKDAFAKITGYGIYQGLTDPDFQIIGGSNYIKRAVYATLEIGGVSATNFDQAALFGNIASAQAYESYLSNSAVINAIVAAESDSVFAIETAINLARAGELGLTKRHRSDWFGGFNALLTEADTNAVQVEFGYDYDAYSGQISRQIGVGDYVIGDTIDIAGQTTIEAGAGADTIDLRSGKLANQVGYTVNGTLNNDIAVSGADFTALSSS
ncbi:MAG: hypothetical protein HEQ34_13820, partial [Sphingorhabdus sp.]